MEDHALTHTDLIRALSDLHAKAEKHAQSLAYYNNEIHLLEHPGDERYATGSQLKLCFD